MENRDNNYNYNMIFKNNYMSLYILKLNLFINQIYFIFNLIYLLNKLNLDEPLIKPNVNNS